MIYHHSWLEESLIVDRSCRRKDRKKLGKLGCEYGNLRQSRSGAYELFKLSSCFLHLWIDHFSEACDGKLVGSIGVVDNAESAQSKLVVLSSRLQEEPYHFVVVPVSEAHLLLVPAPSG